MKPYLILLKRIIQLESIVAELISERNKLKADTEYIAMMTDVDIIIEEEKTDEQ